MTKLTEKAMLSSLTIRQWTARRRDAEVTRRIHDEYHAHDAGRFNKELIRPEAMATIRAIVREARVHHYTNTLPWDETAGRILPAANYWPYADAQQQFRIRFEAAVRDFVAKYPQHVEEARVRLNGMFREADYPRQDDLWRRFDMRTTHLPIPEGGDWRVTLGDEEETRIREQLTRSVEQSFELATRDLWNRLHDVVSKLHASLGREDGRFHSSLLDNVRSLVDLLPALNVTGDPKLDAMRCEIEKKLLSFDALDIRKTPGVRSEATTTAEDILAKMSAYTGDLS